MIRDVLADDLESVTEIERASFKKPWSKTDFETEIERERSIFKLLEEDGAVCGYFVVYTVLDESELADIAVSPKHRGKGYGRLLLAEAVRSADKASVMFLEVAVDNFSAVGLYESFGFEKVGYIKDYYGQDNDAYIMKLNINGEVRNVEKQY
ncbi:ribosomal-protein-alanine N-acetyltransferase [Geovibrio thiophilus]|uniref:[Ribosomal protein bS18]-alanine N-acetyltransferase n=1 Tax=Geovibrio thiophilus TaxID=139438 RepID=A0A410JYZ9_9BACT|nr:ribosomal protein S18-alanine N-acetyltransferase [Geovibrio thiophilus]QAR33258.1 ribosomal-protein-alanine N-acetyltransferase [Geovibrio thiophilus]